MMMIEMPGFVSLLLVLYLDSIYSYECVILIYTNILEKDT